MEVYRLGCVHRQAHAERADLHSKLTDPLGRYDGPLYRSPGGYAVFSHDDHEAGFHSAYLADYGTEHADPCPDVVAATADSAQQSGSAGR